MVSHDVHKEASIKEGDTQQTLVSAAYSDGSSVTVSSGITFNSSNPVVAKIDAEPSVSCRRLRPTRARVSSRGRTSTYIGMRPGVDLGTERAAGARYPFPRTRKRMGLHTKGPFGCFFRTVFLKCGRSKGEPATASYSCSAQNRGRVLVRIG